MQCNESGRNKPPERQRSTASQPTGRTPEYSWLQESTRTVLEHLETLDVGERTYLKSRDLVDELDYDTQEIGQALGVIASKDLATSVTVSEWGESAGMITWLVEPRRDDQADAPLVTDGGQNFVRLGRGAGGTFGVWECPECDTEVQSDHTTFGLDCPDCGATVVEGSR